MPETSATVGAFEAKTHFSQLLERGEEIVITKRGRPVARLVPASAASDAEALRRNFHRVRELMRQGGVTSFDWEEWKGYRDEGRR